MKLMVWKQNEGPTDEEFKQGDIFQVKPDTWTPGTEEDLKWLIVQMPNFGGSWSELTASEFTVGESTQENVLLRMRKYYLSFDVLTPSQRSKLLDPTVHTPMVTNVWGLNDILRR